MQGFGVLAIYYIYSIYIGYFSQIYKINIKKYDHFISPGGEKYKIFFWKVIIQGFEILSIYYIFIYIYINYFYANL